mmetsp:Transcript_19247/g.57812  ORF Transcript_19247/g.57812 Transcript_19247/m.57812 type:complete len:208 (-) Transcript_19247:3-626(-)
MQLSQTVVSQRDSGAEQAVSTLSDSVQEPGSKPTADGICVVLQHLEDHGIAVVEVLYVDFAILVYIQQLCQVLLDLVPVHGDVALVSQPLLQAEYASKDGGGGLPRLLQREARAEAQERADGDAAADRPQLLPRAREGREARDERLGVPAAGKRPVRAAGGHRTQREGRGAVPGSTPQGGARPREDHRPGGWISCKKLARKPHTKHR